MPSIYVMSPSGAVRDRPALRRGIRRLQALGHTVTLDEAALAVHQRFAGDDATRLDAIVRAAASGADVVMITRGGYGLTRLLADLPYGAIAESIQRGTRWIGFSDFTALQAALLARTGCVTWAGPAVGEDFGAPEGPDDIMEACFDDVVADRAEGTGWRLPVSRAAATADASKTVGDLTVREATLWGGNLTVLSSLLGTPFFPDIRDGILFVEDVGEHPYRIERMLDQWHAAGILQRQQAVLLGQFTAFKRVPADRGFGLPSVVERLRTRLPVPVLTGLPHGHVPTKVLLPVGARVDLVIEGREALLLWGHDITPGAVLRAAS